MKWADLLWIVTAVTLLSIPSLLARRGIGTRGQWFGGTAGFVLLAVGVYIIENGLWSQVCTGISWDAPGSGYDALCMICAIAFAPAGFFYKPKRPERSLFDELKGETHARRSNGKKQGD
jgi:hypothetical protein